MRRRGPGPGPMAGRMARRMAVRMRSRRRRRRRRRRLVLVGGMIALGATAVHKFSKKDVERIEEHTGKSAEELTDEELQKATNDLNIQSEELSDEEWDAIEKADDEDDDYLAELERLGELHEKGIVTDEEFETKKKQLLGL